MRSSLTTIMLCCGMQVLFAQSYERHTEMGIDAFQDGRYDDAQHLFEKAVELNPNQSAGHYWQGKLIVKLNPEDERWLAQPHYQRAYDLLREKPARRMNGAEKKYVEDASLYLALWSFNPTGTHEPKLEDVSCEAVRPYITRLFEVNPENTQADDLVKFCNELNARRGKKGRRGG